MEFSLSLHIYICIHVYISLKIADFLKIKKIIYYGAYTINRSKICKNKSIKGTRQIHGIIAIRFIHYS